MKRQILNLVTLGFLGLVAAGCTERNPAFHKRADGGTVPRADTATTTAADAFVAVDSPADTPATPKDAERVSDTPTAPGDTRLGDAKLVDSEGAGEVGPKLTDARELDGRVEADGAVDVQPPREAGLDTVPPDAAPPDGMVSPPPDTNPIIPDAAQADTPQPTEDAGLPPELDALEADAYQPEDVAPDADELDPDAWTEDVDAELDSL